MLESACLNTASTCPLLTVRDGEHTWLIKPKERWGSLRWTVTEYVSAELVHAVGLPVPEQRAVYLSAAFLREHSGLGCTYQVGFNLGVRHHTGFTLREARASARLGGFAHAACTSQVAAGIVVTDTWLANFDRSHDSYAPAAHVPAENEGNLFFACERDAWQLYAIDYSHALAMCHWGCWANETWPPELLGTMSFFFERGWLGPQLEMAAFEPWLARIEGLELKNTLRRIREAIPKEWLAGDPYYREADWQDLAGRLERQRGRLGDILRTKYAQAAKHALQAGQARRPLVRLELGERLPLRPQPVA